MSQALIDGLYSVLKRDEAFMAFFGLTPTSLPKDASLRLIKSKEPDQAITSKNVPQILMYVVPGRFSIRNHLVFQGKFRLDFYAPTAADARNIAQCAFELLHDKYISHESFKSFKCHLVFDDDLTTGITGVKGYLAIYDVDFVRR
ncbi:hypothetical protein BK133_05110 [Paenibacillus sp. FSL H8-0548]|uniref:hypothetical protein n=1 Tax=Paenibacillus sp. FSL H8-0548 TaxID=1920422 RepID=UPI00096DE4D8|nr:hypothetical protein [Paenibacillus sp. FSL H8-0548]OMF37436.1 hypothetical protein BK133_05110 [Paenibacillus sp. FSL H8-0548]